MLSLANNIIFIIFRKSKDKPALLLQILKEKNRACTTIIKALNEDDKI